MAVTYKKLWHILLDRDMKKKDLQETAELTKYTMRKLGNDEAVTTDTLAKICRALNCTVDDIMEVLPEDKCDKSVLWDTTIDKMIMDNCNEKFSL